LWFVVVVAVVRCAFCEPPRLWACWLAFLFEGALSVRVPVGYEKKMRRLTEDVIFKHNFDSEIYNNTKQMMISHDFLGESTAVRTSIGYCQSFPICQSLQCFENYQLGVFGLAKRMMMISTTMAPQRSRLFLMRSSQSHASSSLAATVF
jgi:hypothetical protein